MEGTEGQIGFLRRSSGREFWEMAASTAVEALTAVRFRLSGPAAVQGRSCAGPVQGPLLTHSLRGPLRETSPTLTFSSFPFSHGETKWENGLWDGEN